MTTICFVCIDGIASSYMVKYNFDNYLDEQGISDITTTVSGTQNGEPDTTHIETMNGADVLVVVRDPLNLYTLQAQGIINPEIPVKRFSTEWLYELSRIKIPKLYKELVSYSNKTKNCP